MTLKNKLKSSRGLTLTEVLVALMILSLVGIGIVSGVGAANKTYRDSVAVSESQLLASTLTEAIMDELRYARDYSKDVGAEVRYTSMNFGVGVSFDIDRTNGHMTLGGIPLVGDGAYSGKVMTVARNSTTPLVQWVSGHFVVNFVITRGTEELQEVTFSVTPLSR